MATTSLRSAADLANNALVRMGYKLRLGTLFDGSEHAQNFLDLYGQARDTLLRDFDYDFSLTTGVLTQLKAAPSTGGYFPPTAWSTAFPMPGFLYEYGYPSTAIKIRSVRPQPLFAITADPEYYAFAEAYDGGERVILSNVPNALCSYTDRVVDPTMWDVSFTEALATKLAALAGPGLVGLEPSKVTIPEGQQAGQRSMMEGR